MTATSSAASIAAVIGSPANSCRFTTLHFGFVPTRAISPDTTAVEAKAMNDWNNLAGGVVSTRFRPPNVITVLFDDRTRTFPMSAAATLTDLAQRLAEEGEPQRPHLLSVTVKLGGAIGFQSRPRPRK
jgi:hypothetical protein